MMSSDQTFVHASDSLPIVSKNLNSNTPKDEFSASAKDSPNSIARKRKRNQCHSQHHIKVMEDCYKISPHPNATKIQELAGEIGLHPLQVKSWFHYKRTQMKLKQSSFVLNSYASGRSPQANIPPPPGSAIIYKNQSVRSANEDNYSGIPNISADSQVVLSAMDELVKMARIGEPLWIVQPNADSPLLNDQEYSRMFQSGLSRKPRNGYKFEASRESTIIMMEAAKVVEIFMDMDKWLTVFSSMISRGMNEQVMPPSGVARNCDRAVQKMYVKFKVLSPTVPFRDYIFVRHSRKLEEQIWVVVDVSFDTLIRNGPKAKCQKRPSGCLIQAMPNNHSKITWVEHVEVQDQMIHSFSYGAKRWISILERHCERNASVTGQTNYPYYAHLNGIGLPSPTGRRNILNLAEKMVKIFCGRIPSPSSDYPWKIILGGHGFDEVHIKTRKFVEYPECHGLNVISASICFWIPILPKTVFNFLRNLRTRAQWDILSYGRDVQEIMCINNGKETGNCVSVLRVHKTNTVPTDRLLLQESSIEPASSSFIVYTSIGNKHISKLSKGENIDEDPPLFPLGFTILPSGLPPADTERVVNYSTAAADDVTVKGSLLTATWQSLAKTPYILSLTQKIKTHQKTQICDTMLLLTQKIKTALTVD